MSRASTAIRRLLTAGMLLLPATTWPSSATAYGDWELQCVSESAPGTGCSISQLNKRRGTDQIVMRSEITSHPGRGLLLSMKVPQDVLLTSGPWLTVDGLYLDQLTYISCKGGCIATLPLDQARLPYLLHGNRGVLTVVLSSGQRIGISLSLKGITEAIRALNSKSGK